MCLQGLGSRQPEKREQPIAATWVCVRKGRRGMATVCPFFQALLPELCFNMGKSWELGFLAQVLSKTLDALPPRMPGTNRAVNFVYWILRGRVELLIGGTRAWPSPARDPWETPKAAECSPESFHGSTLADDQGRAGSETGASWVTAALRKG